MPTRKVADLEPNRGCTHPDHSPPSMRVFEPGFYEHTCPECGKVTMFCVPRDEMKPSSPWKCVPKDVWKYYKPLRWVQQDV